MYMLLTLIILILLYICQPGTSRVQNSTSSRNSTIFLFFELFPVPNLAKKFVEALICVLERYEAKKKKKKKKK